MALRDAFANVLPSHPLRAGLVPARWSITGKPIPTSSWHRLGPSDMPLEAKRSRHVAVAIPEIRVRRGIAVSPRQESPQPQQPDLAYHQTLIGWRFRQPGDRGLGFGHVTVGPMSAHELM